jgi:molecular chaperone DnaK (HSP70)
MVMKLFQIEEPDGSPVDPNAPGVAIGIDIGGAEAEVAVAVGGNATVLADREGFALDLRVPSPAAPDEAWQHLFEGARLRAERSLAQPVTHAVVAVASAPDPAMEARLSRAGEAAGLTLLRIVARREIGAGPPVLDAAILAEDLAPRPQAP